MITLLYLIRRRPDLTPEAFRTAALAAQAHTAQAVRNILGATEHSLAFEACAKRSHCMAMTRRLGGERPDAVIELTWPSLAVFDAHMGTPAALRALEDIIDAERSWVDFRHSATLLVEKEDIAPKPPKTTRHSKAELLDEAI
ncbi:MAG: hypothetical protein ACPGOY_02180 [Rhodospirillaceae bacterium]